MHRTLRWAGLLAMLSFVATSLPGATSAATAPSTPASVTAAPLPIVPPVPPLDNPSFFDDAPPAQSRRLVLDGAQLIAIYGHPGVPIMGLLGKHDPEGAAREAKRLAAEWDDANGPEMGAVGALHLITYVAQPTPMADGSYLARMTAEEIAPYLNAARRHGLLLILDIQIGMGDPLAETQRLVRFLREPDVHLALDPEFAMHAVGGRPGQRIGSLDATDVNRVQQYLAGLVEREGLPPKVLLLHQFMASMLTGTEWYEDLPEVARVIDMDGWGNEEVKLAHYAMYSLASYAQRPAIKLFYEWDEPVLTQERLLALPVVPEVVIYQ